MIKKIMVFFLAAFGTAEDFLETRQGGEAAFWQRSKGSVLQAARQWPGGMGWYYLGKRLLMRFLLPPVLIFVAAVTLLLAGFGGWVAVREQADAEAQSEAASKQAFERLEQRVLEVANGKK